MCLSQPQSVSFLWRLGKRARDIGIHKKKKQKRVIDPYEADVRERYERWMAYVKSGKLTTEQAHTCEELEVFVCAVIVFGGISPEDTVINKRA